MPPKKKEITASAERHRKYLERIKSDPEAHASYLQKQRAKYQERKSTGKIKSINDKSEREQRNQRKRWRVNSTTFRKSLKQTPVVPMTPPHSPDEEGPSTSTVRRGRPRIRDASRSKAYRRIARLENTLEEKNRLIATLRKRCQRMQDKLPKDSPRSKTNIMLGKNNSNINSQKISKIRKTLIFHHALVNQISNLQSSKNQRTLVQTLSQDIIKKYRCKSIMQKQTSLKRSVLDKPFKKKHRLLEKSKAMRKAVQNFLERDDNSRMSSNKKDTKGNKQVRFLLHTLKILHKKYLSEGHIKVSLAYFQRNRPPHIRKPTLKDRDVCVCKLCENFKLKFEKLLHERIIQTADAEEVIKLMVCDIHNMDCMYGMCSNCRSKHRISAQTNYLDKMVECPEWSTVQHTYKTKDGLSKTTKKSMKINKQMTIKTLIETVNKSIATLMKHLYRVYHQYIVISSLKANLREDSALMHFDFSENWNCKHARETTDVHFGASQVQATLHTGLLYTSNKTEGFCSISPSNVHDSSGVWAHLKPVLEYVRHEYPHIVHLHFLSDSPSSQYRNKSTFFLLGTIPQELGFESTTWNFLESGHGKGAADGIGAAVKREADRIVANGQDVPDADKLYEYMKTGGSTIRFLYISDAEISNMAKLVNIQLRAIPGTMQVHQVWSDYAANSGRLFYRNLSCYCDIESTSYCDCYSPKEWCLISEQNDSTVVTPKDTDGLAEGSVAESKSCTTDDASNGAVPKSKYDRSLKKKKAGINDDCQCLVCSEWYHDSAGGETWIKCRVCHQWAHELCTSFDPAISKTYTCDNCE